MSSRPKLQPNDHELIRMWAQLGTNVPTVAKRFRVSPRTIWAVIRDKHKSRGWRAVDQK